MPLTKRGKLKKEKKLQEHRERLSKETGIFFSAELTSNEKESFPFLKYIVNAIILFGASFGAMDCLVSAFRLEVTIIPLVITCIIFSLIFSFMYASYRAKVITYLFVLVGVISSSFGFFVVINSGISAIRNNIMKYINDHSGLPFLREYSVYFEDEFTAMSIALCVLAVGLMILINIVVSEKMSLRGIFYISFPVAQFGMFFGYSVSKFAMICLMTSWLLVAILEFSNSYNGLTHTMQSASSVKKHIHSYGFVTDSHNVSKMAVMWLLVLFCISAFAFTILPTDNFEVNLPSNKIKQSTERVVKNFLSYGLSSMWSVERESTEPGQLSNVETVGFDNRTDLEVTLVNYRQDRLYLRSFVGYNFDNSDLKWQSFQSVQGIGCEEEFAFTPKLLQYDFEHKQIVSKSWHRYDVKLKDIEKMNNYLYVPYYAYNSGKDYKYLSSGEVTKSGEGQNVFPVSYIAYSLDVTNEDYKAIIDSIEDEKIKEEFEITLAKIKKDAYENALFVPENNVKAIKNFCITYNINASDKDVVTKVISALENNFEYTLRPGKLPYGEDYINYFLNANMKGYCQHFATAATMIFRYLGIPARYVEGYAIDREDFYKAQSVTGENIDDWIKTPYMADIEPLKVEVPDSSGHAWVEIYKDGIGWVTVEATTAPSADGSGGFLSNLLSRATTTNFGSNALAERVREINTEKTKSRIVLLIEIAVLLLLIWYVTFVSIKVIKRHKSFRNEKLNVNISNRYKHLYSIWQFAYNKENINLTYSEFFNLLYDNSYITANGTQANIKFEEILFSGEQIEEKICLEMIATFNEARKNIYKQMSFTKKFKYCFTKVLW